MPSPSVRVLKHTATVNVYSYPFTVVPYRFPPLGHTRAHSNTELAYRARVDLTVRAFAEHTREIVVGEGTACLWSERRDV